MSRVSGHKERGVDSLLFILDPKSSLERYFKTLPWKNREEVDRVIDAARKRM